MNIYYPKNNNNNNNKNKNNNNNNSNKNNNNNNNKNNNKNYKQANLFKLLLGFFIYFILFVVLIPYLLIKFKQFEFLGAYFPNLDLIASVIQYDSGPTNLFSWKDLYNFEDKSFRAFISGNLINYYALLGVTYLIAHYTLKYKDIDKGWSRAFITIPMTYLIPSNIIIDLMNNIGKILNLYISKERLINYLIMVLFGMLIAISFILGEVYLISLFSQQITNLIKLVKKNLL